MVTGFDLVWTSGAWINTTLHLLLSFKYGKEAMFPSQWQIISKFMVWKLSHLQMDSLFGTELCLVAPSPCLRNTNFKREFCWPHAVT